MPHKSLKRKARAVQRIGDALVRRLHAISIAATLTVADKAALPTLRKAAQKALQSRRRLNRRIAKGAGAEHVPVLARSGFKVSAQYRQRLAQDGPEAAYAWLESLSKLTRAPAVLPATPSKGL